MLTLGNSEVRSTLMQIGQTAYPERSADLKSFSVEVFAKESKSVHGDYHTVTRKIRIFNLSRPTASIVKTTIHELAHHVDCSFYGRTGHDKQFYTTLKHLLETAHRMCVINLDDVRDEIDVADMRQLVRTIGPLEYAAQTKQRGLLIKVDNAFAIKDELKERGYKYSPTERLWILQADQSILDDEQGWLHEVTEASNIDVVPVSENKIDSIYFCVLGKKGFFGKQDALKAAGYRWNDKAGWYKRIPAADKDATVREVASLFACKAVFRGAL